MSAVRVSILVCLGCLLACGTGDIESGDDSGPGPGDGGEPGDDSGSGTPDASEPGNDSGSGGVDAGPVEGALFPSTSIWYQDRSGEAKHPDSDAVVAWMAQDGNSFDPDGEFRIDVSFTLYEVDDSVPFRTFTKNGSFYDGDCDYGELPVPPDGRLEGESDYSCAGDGDCHLLVIYKPNHLLFEMWRANIPGGAYDSSPFYGGCMAVWDLQRDYGWNVVEGLDHDHMGRGLDCTSADAAGYPIAPLLFTPQEIADGHINHALRFILPNRNIRHLIYVSPSTHSTGPTGGPITAPPYGAQFRLKGDAALATAHPEIDFASLSPGGKAIIDALQTYGMFLADGGSIALTGMSDVDSPVKYCNHDLYEWCDEDPDRLLHEHDLKFLRITDFEMLDNGGPEREWAGNCNLLYEYDDTTHTVVDAN